MSHADLLRGYHRFYSKYFFKDHTLYDELAEGQTPHTLIIACSDSRVDPAILLDAKPGSIFVVRNVANLIPPYKPDNDYHGTSAAIEYAVNYLNVEDIIILGHSNCGGIKALMDTDNNALQTNSTFIAPWVNIAKEAKIRALNKYLVPHETKYTACEKESIITSHQNLMTFPWIKEKVLSQKISVYGWYFSIDNGSLSVLNKDTNRFETVEVNKR